ncbi:MAG TPA: DUF3784 domain-containing protein [Bacillus sp. (in: firmicutes)]|uniref:DUF3784 domain-containing protein n=1 Tax=Bacillus litorisediminis TaxID=2922713 RepID=UPI001FAC6232|nr:DUF3784 domain-containing protein [Bacillus litorisediminis]HWO74448.1 DUF3784 domain-containing protein [Bacillus sp. (in: firmicutes)]
MNQHFIVIGAILLVLAYLIGYKKQTWLLSGFNYRRVKDQKKLASLVGSYNLAAGIVFIISSFIDNPDVEILLPIFLMGFVVLLVYVNTKMVE